LSRKQAAHDVSHRLEWIEQIAHSGEDTAGHLAYSWEDAAGGLSDASNRVRNCAHCRLKNILEKIPAQGVSQTVINDSRPLRKLSIGNVVDVTKTIAGEHETSFCVVRAQTSRLEQAWAALAASQVAFLVVASQALAAPLPPELHTQGTQDKEGKGP
jgi:hypothetical protein